MIVRDPETPEDWMYPDWLPELSVIKWPRLDKLRVEHQGLLASYAAAEASVRLVDEKFAAEDRGAEQAAMSAARNGQPPPETSVTPALSRRAEKQVAAERAHEALVALCDHVELATREIIDHLHEAQEARNQLIAETTVPAPTSDIDARPLSEEMNAEAEEWLANAVAVSARHASTHRELRKDWTTVQTLLLTKFTQTGENVFAEVERYRSKAVAR